MPLNIERLAESESCHHVLPIGTLSETGPK